MNVVIIKYNAGNIRSVLFALERIGVTGIVTDNVEIINGADKIIFPGVGEASSAMKHLKENKMDELVSSLKQPVLGICLGMQLMCKHSEEGNVDCLGIFDQPVKLFKGEEKVPQVGWNNIMGLKGKLFDRIKEDEYMYFVHSYYVSLGINTIACANYTHVYSAALQKNNFYAVQFHPERSGIAGQRILENFLAL